jgi:hypothetical protein
MINAQTRKLDCFVAFAPRNDVAHTPPPSRRAMRPSDAGIFRPLELEGAGNAGCALHPQSRVRKLESTRGSHHRFTGAIRHSPRNGFNGLLRALPGDRAFLSPSQAELNSANLTPASRRQDHTTSPSASRTVRQRCASRPPHPAPRS